MSDTADAILDRILHSLGAYRLDFDRISLRSDVDDLGSGGYGTVKLGDLRNWNGHDMILVAVKVLRPPGNSKSYRTSTAARLAREAKVWAGLVHPNILSMVGFCLNKEADEAWLISPYEPHGNLTDYLVCEAPNTARKLQLIICVGRGLKFLHTRDPIIVHGDLKPANVIIGKDGLAKLCDFGLTKALEDPTGLTSTTSIKGSPRYMSPELFEEEAVITPYSDIWAFGCVVGEVLTGVMPYHGEIKHMRLILRINRKEQPISLDGPEVPTAAQTLIKNCWADPANSRSSISSCVDGLIMLETARDSSQGARVTDCDSHAQTTGRSKALTTAETISLDENAPAKVGGLEHSSIRSAAGPVEDRPPSSSAHGPDFPPLSLPLLTDEAHRFRSGSPYRIGTLPQHAHPHAYHPYRPSGSRAASLNHDAWGIPKTDVFEMERDAKSVIGNRSDASSQKGKSRQAQPPRTGNTFPVDADDIDGSGEDDHEDTGAQGGAGYVDDRPSSFSRHAPNYPPPPPEYDTHQYRPRYPPPQTAPDHAHAHASHPYPPSNLRAGSFEHNADLKTNIDDNIREIERERERSIMLWRQFGPPPVGGPRPDYKPGPAYPALPSRHFVYGPGVEAARSGRSNAGHGQSGYQGPSPGNGPSSFFAAPLQTKVEPYGPPRLPMIKTRQTMGPPTLPSLPMIGPLHSHQDAPVDSGTAPNNIPFTTPPENRTTNKRQTFKARAHPLSPTALIMNVYSVKYLCFFL